MAKKNNNLLAIVYTLIVISVLLTLSWWLFMGNPFSNKSHADIASIPKTPEKMTSAPINTSHDQEASDSATVNLAPTTADNSQTASQQSKPKAQQSLDYKLPKEMKRFIVKVTKAASVETEDSAYVKTNVGEIQIYLVTLDEKSGDALFNAKPSTCLDIKSKEALMVPADNILLYADYQISAIKCP